MKPTDKASTFSEQVSPFYWTVRCSLFWLVLANSVGLLLATMLLWPELNNLLRPYTYGRWMPLHLNFQLYGWSSVPLLGILFILYLPKGPFGGCISKLVLLIWTLALLFSGALWLHGEVSGKIFLDWNEESRLLFPLVLFILWCLLLIAFIYRRRMAASKTPEPTLLSIGKCSFLAALLLVPLAFYFVLTPELYPPINIRSGGATGAALLASTLGVIVLFCLMPPILLPHCHRLEWELGGKTALPKLKQPTRAILIVALGLLAHYLFYSLLNRGNSSNYDSSQILGLATLLIWIPLTAWYYLQFPWPKGARLWLNAFGAWAVVLIFTALVMFLPGMLEKAKFSNVLVAHVHIAMAGMIFAFNMLLLSLLLPSKAGGGALLHKRNFLLWQAGLVLLLLGLLCVGSQEYSEPRLLYTSQASVLFGYSIRLCGGLLMTGASLCWLFGLSKERVDAE